MGRRQYLTRLALGRSPYQDDTEQDASSSRTPLVSKNGPDISPYAQQYDAKGRPINPAVETERAKLRDAQNSVLALVGVVEDRSSKEQEVAKRAKHMKNERRKVLVAETDLGEELDLVTSVARSLGLWFAESLTMRFQIGFFEANLSFMEVIWMEVRRSRINSWRGLLSVLAPGAPSYLLHQSVRAGLAFGAELITDSVQKLVIRQPGLRYKTAKTIRRVCDVLLVVSMAAIDVVLLPFEYHTTVQMLGLQPSTTWFPPLQAFFPNTTNAVHQALLRPIIGTPILRYTAVPGCLLLLRCILFRDLADPTSMVALLTSFRYPTINDCLRRSESGKQQQLQLWKDPLGHTLQQALNLRIVFTRWCGWNVSTSEISRRGNGVTLENDMSVERHQDGSISEHQHRATSLAHLVPTFLAVSVDQLLQTVLLLPFDIFTMRIVTASFMASPFQRSIGALIEERHLSRPFDALMYSHAKPVPPLQLLGKFASNIGLSLALQASTHVVLFAGVYRVSRYFGIRGFDWGSRCKIGSVSYTFPPNNE